MTNKLTFINFDTNYISNTTTPFDTTFVLSDPLRRVKHIYLKSVEMPIGFTNIRSGFDTLILQLIIQGRPPFTTTITLPHKNYTSIASLISMINLGISSVYYYYASPTTYPQFVVNSDNTITVSNNTNTVQFNFLNTNLLTQILGFTTAFPSNTTNTSTSVNSNRIYNLNYDTYLSFYCSNIPHKSAGFGNQLMTFKIPFNGVSSSIFFEAENISYNHYVDITDKGFILDKLKFQIYDQFQNVLDNNGLNWSFTLAFEFWGDDQ